MPNEKREIKVTDKRMFTAEGNLKEEYRFLDEKSTAPAAAEAAPPPPEPASRQAAPPPPPARAPEPYETPRWPAEPERTPLDLPATPPEMEGPGFYDLVAMMAEPVPIYLGDARLPDGQVATDLEMARLHIDLLDVLRQKTAGNLDPQERAFLEDLLYRLRVRYVQKRG
ncbi:MAG TPA: DUF1844 domain-containing protein [Thermoanaerobaculia bacterium]